MYEAQSAAEFRRRLIEDAIGGDLFGRNLSPVDRERATGYALECATSDIDPVEAAGIGIEFATRRRV
jgi:hypothetical protein